MDSNIPQKLEEIPNLLTGTMKKLEPMLDQLRDMAKQLPNLAPIEKNKIFINGKEASASMLATGAVLIEFTEKENSKEYYEQLKRCQ